MVTFRTGRDSFPTWGDISPRPLRGRIGKSPCIFCEPCPRELGRHWRGYLGFPGGSDGKDCLQCRKPGFNPGLRRSLGEGNGNPLKYSCLENSMDRGVWRAKVHRVEKSQTWLSDITWRGYLEG